MKREGTVHAWRIYYHHLLWNTVANHLVQHSVCKITSVWPWNLCIEGFYNWSSHTGWWEQPQRHCSLLVTGHDGDLPWLILPAQSLCQQGSQATSCSSNFQRGLACQTSKVKHKSLNLLKVLETITFSFVVSWARACGQLLQITKGENSSAAAPWSCLWALELPIFLQGTSFTAELRSPLCLSESSSTGVLRSSPPLPAIPATFIWNAPQIPTSGYRNH